MSSRPEDTLVHCGQGQVPITCQRKHLLSAASLYYTAVDRQCRHNWPVLAGTSIFTTQQRSPYRRDNTIDPCWSLRVSWSSGRRSVENLWVHIARCTKVSLGSFGRVQRFVLYITSRVTLRCFKLQRKSSALKPLLKTAIF